MLPAHTPVCIIGAGPAGATASLALSKKGIPHVIVDKADFPRDKVCGDGLDTRVMRVLRHLDPDWLHEFLTMPDVFLPIHGVRIAGFGRHYTDCLYRPEEAALDFPPFVTGRRVDFDHFLVGKLPSAVATVALGMEVTQLERDGGGWQIGLRRGGETFGLRADMILGADGDHSAVLRALGQRKIDRRHYAAGLRYYFEGVGGISQDKPLLELHVSKVLPMGYLWIFPLSGGQANVGLGMQSAQQSQLHIRLPETFEQIIRQTPDLRDRFAGAKQLGPVAGWGLPLASRSVRRFGDRYLLLGDAGSLINPLSGEGIGNAMFSGYVAAHYAARAVQTARYQADTLAGYEEENISRLQRERLMYRVMTHPSMPFQWYNWLIHLLERSGIAGWYLQKGMSQWIRTCHQRPIRLREF